MKSIALHFNLKFLLKRNKMTSKTLFSVLMVIAMIFGISSAQAADKIVHDGEYNYIEAQHSEEWAKEDKLIDAKLDEIRKRNGGKRPNILYILVDDGRCCDSP